MTVSEFFQEIPRFQIFMTFLVMMQVAFLIGLICDRLFAICIGPLGLIGGIWWFIAKQTNPPAAVSPVILFTSGLLASTYMGVCWKGLTSEGKKRLACYGLFWFLSSWSFCFILLLSANSRGNPFVYAGIGWEGLTLCGFLGAVLCLPARPAYGNLQRKPVFAGTWLAAGLLAFAVVAVRKEDFYRVRMSGYAQENAIRTIGQIGDTQEKFRVQCLIDQNSNGIGEYAYMDELTDNRDLRGSNTRLEKRLIGEQKYRGLEKYIYLQESLQGFHPTGAAGVYEKDCYLYAIYLVGNGGYHRVPSESPSAEVISDQERWFACFAWPALPAEDPDAAKLFVATPGETIYYRSSKLTGCDAILPVEELFARNEKNAIIFLPSEPTPFIK